VIHRPGDALRAALAGLAVVAALVLVGCSSDAPGSAAPGTTTAPTADSTTSPRGFGSVTLVVTLPDGSVREYCVWLAETAEQRQQGLMGVTDADLGGRSAMLFRFPGDTTSSFWMKDTVLPLSIAWYAVDGTLVSTADMDPCPAGTADCPVFDPGGRYRYAIEVAQGGLDRLGLVEGSTISLGAGCEGSAQAA